VTQIQHAIVRGFDAGTYTATIEVPGSISVWVGGVAVARNIAGAELITGRNCAVMHFDPANPQDAVLAAVWT
jgi:hypothetical protein